MPDFKETLLLATEAAGKIMLSYFQGNFSVKNKDTINNLVTEVDTRAETAIVDIIKSRHPDHSILSEEMGSWNDGTEYKWVIDPIDGTVNFAHGIPICGVSIGLCQGDTVILGAVFNPMMNELFVAEKGRGASLNGTPIKVSKKTNFAQACLVTGFPYKWPDVANDPIKVFEALIKQGLPVRRLGSAAIDLCWVACGRFDGFWEYNLNPWDVAAGYLIVSEAGGKISDFSGNSGNIYGKETLATNGLIHDTMLYQIQKGTGQ